MNNDDMEEMFLLIREVRQDLGYRPEAIVFLTKIALDHGFNPQSGYWDDIVDAVYALTDFYDFPNNDPDYLYEYETNSDNYSELEARYVEAYHDAIKTYNEKVK